MDERFCFLEHVCILETGKFTAFPPVGHWVISLMFDVTSVNFSIQVPLIIHPSLIQYLLLGVIYYNTTRNRSLIAEYYEDVEASHQTLDRVCGGRPGGDPAGGI